uniref:MICOS complex subunit MIC60 n=1 Tax=Calcidiscus leptoporus TaxID=127549 RepID=A0A7S0JBG7_9EUKA|mmetsp:Transcript_4862/g.11064  ORF Transcript_4862/g.11064 Transcript_4862/m.11064 type:complete len:437 (+) Transcript_4862:15-1325(+)
MSVLRLLRTPRLVAGLLAGRAACTACEDDREASQIDALEVDSSAGGNEGLRRFETLPMNDALAFLSPPTPPTPPPALEEQATPGLQEATEALQRKVDHLKALLEERASVDAEAWRVQKAVQHQEEADAEKLMALLRAHEEAYAADLEETKAEIEGRIVLRMREEQEVLAAKHDEQLAHLEQAYVAQLKKNEEVVVAAAQQRIDAAVAARSAELITNHDAALLTERKAFAEKLFGLHVQVDALAAAWSFDSRYKRASHAAHQLSAAVLSLEESLSGRSALSAASQVAALPSLAQRLDDPLLGEAAARLGPVAEAAALSQLQARFEVASKAARIAALVPQNSGLWGRLLASAVWTLSLGGDALPGDAARSEASAVLGKAERHLARGELQEAARAVRTLRGPPAAACSGWLAAAEDRLLLEQVMAVAKAEASLAVSALS